MPSQVLLSEQIRRAVESSGKTITELSHQTGIHKSTLSRFLSGERGLPMNTLDVLGKHLGLRVVGPDRKGK